MRAIGIGFLLFIGAYLLFGQEPPDRDEPEWETALNAVQIAESLIARHLKKAA